MGKYATEDDLIYNTSTRIPVCLVVDTSSSMLRITDDLTGVAPSRQEFRDGQMWNIFDGNFNTSMTQVVEGVNRFYDAIREDELAKDSCEIAIVTFDDNVKVLEDFQTIDQKETFKEPPTGDNTNLGAAVNKALDLLDERKQQYKRNGVEYYQPWIIILTDGDATDVEVAKQAQERCRRLEDDKKLTVFAFAIGDADKSKLQPFSRRKVLSIKDDKIKEFFEWLGKSVSIVTTTPTGEKVKLDTNVDEWLSLDDL
ncbi:MAG: VWA domain-containing protein [Bacilli bacterium]|nr:VWA domain-containing protein [Bacilli bacterium]